MSLTKNIISRLTSDQKKFIAEVAGTFIVVVLATGAVVIDAKFKGILGIPFIALLPFIGVAIGVYLFAKMSMAHFNQAVTLGFLITGHITILQLVYYFTAQIVGALLGSLFVKYIIGNEANLGANAPNYAFQLPEVFGIEVLASALLMAIILVVVYTKGLGGFGGLAIGGIVGLDILFLAFISGASMNPFIRTSFGVWGSPEFMAILECHFHRNIYNRIIGKKEVFHHKTNPNKLQ